MDEVLADLNVAASAPHTAQKQTATNCASIARVRLGMNRRSNWTALASSRNIRDSKGGRANSKGHAELQSTACHSIKNPASKPGLWGAEGSSSSSTNPRLPDPHPARQREDLQHSCPRDLYAAPACQFLDLLIGSLWHCSTRRLHPASHCHLVQTSSPFRRCHRADRCLFHLTVHRPHLGHGVCQPHCRR
jgi:hypothetical protein